MEPSRHRKLPGYLSQGEARDPPSMGPSVLPMPQPRDSMAMPLACSVGLHASASIVFMALAHLGHPQLVSLASMSNIARLY